MRKVVVGVALVAATALVLAWATSGRVAAQERARQLKAAKPEARAAQAKETQRQRRPQGGADQQARRRRFMQARMMMTRMMGSNSVAICAHGDYIYVVRGNTLYQFTAEDLQLVNKVQLEERPTMGRGPGGPGGPRPGGPGGPRPGGRQ